jgi:rubrerythrin
MESLIESQRIEIRSEHENAYLRKSDRLKIEDLDWSQASQHLPSEDIIFLLNYFADVEGQVFYYARDLMNTSSAQAEEVRNFLTIWSYQEYFHSVALRRYLKECKQGIFDDRDKILRKKVSFEERFTDFAGFLFSNMASEIYLALYLSWGAINEAMTMRGYSQIAQTTISPVLSELCKRIAKQEAFHFGWYYTKAKEQLSRSDRTQKVVRYLLSKAWTPVGVGVKTKDEFKRIFSILFSDENKRVEIIEYIDNTVIDNMPGLSGLNLLSTYNHILQKRTT